MTLIMALILRWKDLGQRFVPLLKIFVCKTYFPLLSDSLDSVNTKSGDSVIVIHCLLLLPLCVEILVEPCFAFTYIHSNFL